ncbi:Scarecrow-like protein 6 [Apostasia shenzhenica]|uniref:Scarecrow-like protein 6 n=1 Tax=Apostasia shenzhenica TaxID=1088818 RepID=A0A2I0BEQ7_9ASPA|nr:Scarecrow-like protein 6 [Apostasia shenzhenica]
MAVVSGDEWAAELQPVPASLRSVEDWESMLPEPAADSGRDPSFLHWFGADADEAVKVDQLFKAAEQIEAGDTISAHRILARLNQQLPAPSGKPLIRSAFFFKEALSSIATPIDVLLKLSAYKAFAEISPVLQFTNFTTTQSILEELTAGANSIHIIDFDLGVGSHWSALIQELSQRRSAAMTVAPKLRITAFTSLGSHHPLELHLIQENLTHFAANLNLPLELHFLPLESFDPVAILSTSSNSAENIAVILPVSLFSYHPLAKTVLSLIKQLSPKIMISVEHGCSRNDLPFSQHFFHAFQSHTLLLESIEASGINPEIAEKIERYLLQPRIESSVLGRYQAGVKLLPWRMLLASAGFVPVKFSNFAETMAECLIKRALVRGFRVSKNQSSLLLSWQQGDIASVSAWRC